MHNNIKMVLKVIQIIPSHRQHSNKAVTTPPDHMQGGEWSGVVWFGLVYDGIVCLHMCWEKANANVFLIPYNLPGYTQVKLCVAGKTVRISIARSCEAKSNQNHNKQNNYSPSHGVIGWARELSRLHSIWWADTRDLTSDRLVYIVTPLLVLEVFIIRVSVEMKVYRNTKRHSSSTLPWAKESHWHRCPTGDPDPNPKSP